VGGLVLTYPLSKTHGIHAWQTVKLPLTFTSIITIDSETYGAGGLMFLT
jgi:hypothetical protein